MNARSSTQSSPCRRRPALIRLDQTPRHLSSSSRKVAQISPQVPARSPFRSNSQAMLSEPVAHRTAVFEYARIMLMSLLFFVYFFDVLGAKTFLDSSFRQLDAALHARTGQVTEVVTAVFPILLLLILVAVVFFTLWGAIRTLRSIVKSASLHHRDIVSMEEFIWFASRQHISITVAREAYRLLEPYYDDYPCIRFSDRLDKLLLLNQTERANLLATLLRDSGRLAMPHPEQHDVLTILELLQMAESSPPHLLQAIA